jgi:2-acylglycerol O-acyltransferase 2
MNLFDAALPFSYVALAVFFFLGVSFTFLFFGLLASVVLIVCIYSGIIRITPILDAITSLLLYLNPKGVELLQENLRKSFLLEYPDGHSESQGVFVFHPHGLFSLTHIFHIGTQVTDWSIDNVHMTVLNKLYWLPFGQEVLDKLKGIPSHYSSMKSALTEKKSISVCLGGVREILSTEPNTMKLSILKKTGVFRLAIETGVPLIPVLSYGENELFDIVKTPWLSSIQDFLIRYGVCLPIPTLESCNTWYSILYRPLKTPIRTVIGKPLDPGPARDPTDEEISKLRERYFESLKDLYSRTKPESYNENLEILA